MQITIKTIDDVLPHIREDSGIIVSERADHTIIDYVFTTDDTFRSDMALQCRGLKFDAEGRIIARPFHKFFNLGERQDPNAIDWSQPHCVVEKLDGTMIHAAVLNGEIVFMTRMGMTEHARNAFSQASDALISLCQARLHAGQTPLFEYTSPANRIVVEYEVPTLTLLAVRDIVSGRYTPDTELRELADHYGIPVTPHHGRVDNIKSFMNDARALEGMEGYVIAFDDGHRLKIKADGYVLRHRALTSVNLEKNVLAWVVENAVDDVVPLLSPDVADRVKTYENDVNAAVARRVEAVIGFFETHRQLERADYAKATLSLDKSLRGAAFALLDGKNARETVLKHLVWAAGSQPRIDDVRHLYGFEWSTEGFGDFDT